MSIDFILCLGKERKDFVGGKSFGHFSVPQRGLARSPASGVVFWIALFCVVTVKYLLPFAT